MGKTLGTGKCIFVNDVYDFSGIYNENLDAISRAINELGRKAKVAGFAFLICGIGFILTWKENKDLEKELDEIREELKKKGE